MKTLARASIHVAVLSLLALGASLTAQEQALDEETLAATVKALRTGEWSKDNVEICVTGLQEREHLVAAGWWLTEAEAAVEKKALPRSARGALAKLRTSWAKAVKKKGAGPGLAKKLLSHAEVLVRSKNFATARAFIRRADAALLAWPDRGTSRIRDRVVKKAGDSGDENQKRLEKLSGKSDTLRTSWSEALGTWLTTGIEEFESWGSRSGYGALAVVSLALGDGHPERMAKVRKAAEGLGLDLERSARLWVMSFKDVDVWLGDRKIGTQAGVMTSLMKRFQGGGEDPKRLDFEVWPGERLVMTLRAPQKIEMPQGMPSFGLSGTPDATCVRLELDGIAVPVTSWLTGRGAKPQDAAATSLAPAAIGVVGPLTGGTSSGPVGGIPGKKATQEVRFDFGSAGASISGNAAMPISPSIEDFFAEDGVEGGWILGRHKEMLFVLDLPAAP